MAKLSPLMLAPPLVFAALAGLFIWGMGREDPNALPSALAGRAAPEMTLPALGDLPALSAADLHDGQPKLVNFFASWCAPCRVEHPTLTALSDEGIALYGINYKDSPAQALSFLAELGNPYRALAEDRSGRAALEWGVYGVPETFVLDGQGRILHRFAGPLTARALESDIRPALARAAAQEGAEDASATE